MHPLLKRHQDESTLSKLETTPIYVSHFATCDIQRLTLCVSSWVDMARSSRVWLVLCEGFKMFFFIIKFRLVKMGNKEKQIACRSDRVTPLVAENSNETRKLLGISFHRAHTWKIYIAFKYLFAFEVFWCDMPEAKRCKMYNLFRYEFFDVSGNPAIWILRALLNEL